MIDEQIFRRFNHTIAACFVIYFLFPEKIIGLERYYLIFLFWLLVIGIEVARFQKNVEILGLRDYEKNRIAGFVWFASGACLLLGVYELDLAPQSFVIGTIIMAAYTDPVIGEANQRYDDKWGVILGLGCSFIIYQLIIGVFFYAIIGSIVAVIAERPKIKWFDDDLAMQIIPIFVMCFLHSYGIGPELVEQGLIIKEGL
jgi:hypothetical protein